MPDSNRYARKTYSPDGVNREFVIDIPYQKVTELNFQLSGVDQPYGTHWTLTSPITARFVSTPPAGNGTLVLTRDTDIDKPAATFTSPGTLTYGNLNRIIKQLLFGVQESHDRSIEAETILDQAQTAANSASEDAARAEAASSEVAGKAHTFANITELRAYTGPASAGLLVARSGPDDGGGGPVGIIPGDTTSPDDGGVIYVDGLGRRWGRGHDGDIDPRWYGHKVDGFTDGTLAVNAALAFIQARGGGTLKLPAGVQIINGPLNYTGSNLSVRGAGPSATQVYKTSTTGHLFNVVGDKLDFQEFWLICSGTHTDGALFNLETTGGVVLLSNVWSYQGYDIYKNAGAGSHLTVSNCTFNNFRRYGIKPGPLWGGLTEISNVNMNCVEANQGAALFLQSGDTFHMSNVNCAGQLQPVVFKPEGGGVLVNIFCTNVFADGIGRTASGFDGWFMDATAAGCTLGRIFLNNCWAGVNRRHGVFIVGPVDVVQMTDCYFVTNLGHGVYATAGPTFIKVNGSVISGNSLLSPGTYNGIEIDNFTSEFTIDSNRSGPTALVTTDNHGYNVRIVGANHDHYRVRDNDLRGGVSGAMLDQGTGPDKTIRDNAGYKTANKGTSSVTSGATSVVVPHGLAVTPAARDIDVRPTNNPTNDHGHVWLDNVDASNFTVNLRNNPGPSNFNFGWEVRCLQ